MRVDLEVLNTKKIYEAMYINYSLNELFEEITRLIKRNKQFRIVDSYDVNNIILVYNKQLKDNRK